MHKQQHVVRHIVNDSCRNDVVLVLGLFCFGYIILMYHITRHNETIMTHTVKNITTAGVITGITTGSGGNAIIGNILCNCFFKKELIGRSHQSGISRF